MKRSYPYTGPQNAQQAPMSNAGGNGIAGQMNSGIGADYSGYGYGAPQTPTNSGNTANDAQQARWHQQWQQYYAQQAAASSNVGGNASMQIQPQPQPQMAPPSQIPGYGYNAGQSVPPVQPQQQSPAAYYGQYSPQQGNVNSTSYGWNQPGYGQPQPPTNAYMNAAAAAAPPPSGPAQAGYYGVASSPQAGPAAKRARLDNGHSNIPTRPPPQGRSMGHGASPASRAPSATHHPIPGRPAVPPHAGGPSNMAGPMASGPSRSFSNNSGQRGMRNQSQHQQGNNRSSGGRNSGGSHSVSSSSSSSGRFNGPMGVNAVGPAAGMSRSGFGQGQRSQQMRKSGPISSRNSSGAHAQQSNRSNRIENNRGGRGQNTGKGPAAEKSGQEDAMEMEKAPLLQGRTTYPAESPVPITAKRTFTDFAIHSIEIDPLQWIWQHEEEEEDAEDIIDDDKSSNATNPSEQKKSRRSRRRSDTKRDHYRLRIAFQSNAPPAGAPTGPKALANGSNEVNTQTSDGVDEENTERDSSKEVKGEAKEAVVHSKTGKIDWSPFSRAPPQLSSNRVILSYASAKRRLTIDSNVIKLIEINRAQGTIRIVVDIITANDSKTSIEDQQAYGDRSKAEEWVIAKGVSLEARNDDQGPYFHVSRPELEACWRDRRGSIPKNGEASSNSLQIKKGEKEGKQEITNEKEDMKLPDEVDGETKFGREGESSVKVEESNDLSSEIKKDGEGEREKTKEKSNGQTVLTDFESLPPLFRLLESHDGPKDETDKVAIQSIRDAKEMTILVTLSDSSAKEAKWIRTGNLSEWLSVLPGMQSSISAEPMSSWIGKMYVVDPDPPLTLTDVYDEWVKKSFIATALQRRSFLQDYNLDTGSGLTELVARIVNVQPSSDRNPNSINTPTEKELAEPLMEAVKETHFDSHHTHFSLLVWTLTRMLLQSSHFHHQHEGDDEEANHNDETLNRIRDLVLSIPMHILFRALDGLCKEAIDKQRMQSTLSRRNKQQQQQNQNMNSPSLSKSTHIGVSTNGDNSANIEPSSRSTSVQPAENDSKVVEAAEEPIPVDESIPVAEGETIEKDKNTMAADSVKMTESASSAV